MPVMQNIVDKLGNKLKNLIVCQDLVLTCKLGDNYPAVNQKWPQ